MTAVVERQFIIRMWAQSAAETDVDLLAGCNLQLGPSASLFAIVFTFLKALIVLVTFRLCTTGMSAECRSLRHARWGGEQTFKMFI